MDIRSKQNNIGFGNLVVKIPPRHNTKIILQGISRDALIEGFTVGPNRQGVKGSVYSFIERPDGPSKEKQEVFAQKLREKYKGLTAKYTKPYTDSTIKTVNKIKESLDIR